MLNDLTYTVLLELELLQRGTIYYRLTDVEQYLHKMNEIQRKWVYLEPIFGRGSMPAETSRFNRVDVDFRSILDGNVNLKPMPSKG